MKKKTISMLVPIALSLAIGSCQHPENDEPVDGSEGPAELEEAPSIAHPSSSAEVHLKAPPPNPVMPDSKKAFGELMRLIEDEYVDGPLPEDELWTGAMEGILARLVHPEGHKINALLSPEQLEDLISGTAGQIVGVGIQIEVVADVLMIKGVISGGPAEAAGLQSGDRILGIDGTRVSGQELRDLAHKIRGEAGTKVSLFVQRDTEEWTVAITRGTVQVSSVEAAMLADAIGYVRVSAFSKNTPELLTAQLQALSDEGMNGMVIDLRHCPGGLLETSIQVADSFLPPGKRVVTVRGRDDAETHHDTQSEDPFETLPLVALVGPKTASSAEILADAISEHGRGLLIGEPTMGKSTVESIHELDGGWAIKLSIARFYSPSGESRERVGVQPDVVIPSDPEAKLAAIEQVDPASDPVLAAATRMLRLR